MNHNISNKLTDRETLVTYSLLMKVMDADHIQADEEKSLLVELRDKLSLTQSDVEKAKKISLEDCKKSLLKFADEKRELVRNLLEEMAMADGEFVQQEKDLIDSLQLGISHFELQLIADWRDSKQKIVGYYSQKDDGKYYFDDIRSLGFTERTYKDGTEITIEVSKIAGLKENCYYEFGWSIALDDSERGFHLVAKDNRFLMVQPKALVDGLYQKWVNSDPDIMAQMTDVQRMVNTQLTASSDGTFIYELLQNANDYPVFRGKSVQLVDVEFHLTDKYLIYRHTGRIFSPRNIAAISKISAGEKKKEKNAIGYKGIGFKTVFSENQYVYLQTGEYSLRFDQSITEESRFFPWQIMPIWTNPDMVDKEVIDIMSDNDEFRVQMAIRPDDSSKLREGDKSFEYIFNDIFQDEKDILFIPNIKSVKVYYDDTEQICRIKDPNKWALTKEPLIYTFSEEEIEENNAEVVANKRIPEKYKDFEDARFSFACRREGRKLLPVEKARIYCYLPTQVSLGFPFLMNTDMIPTGPRDDFEKKVKFNHKLMTIAGRKLVEWLKSLLICEEYDFDSVFSLVPSFTSVNNYEDFIEEIKSGFEDTLKVTELVPVIDNDEVKLVNVSKIIYDVTGISECGLFSDSELLKYANGHEWSSEPDEYFAHPDIRGKHNFSIFIENYHADNMEFSQGTILSLCDNEDFKAWMKIEENNHKFLEFLLDNNHLPNFIQQGKYIFLGNDGDLYSAKFIYENIDEEDKYIPMFCKYIPHLSPETRKFFSRNDKWKEVTEGCFKSYDAIFIVTNYILPSEEARALLNNPQNSVAFHRYLAEKDIDLNENKNIIPYITVSGEIIADYDNYKYFYSDDVNFLIKQDWLGNNKVNVLSPLYFDGISDDDKDRLCAYFEHLGFSKFDRNAFIKDVIVADSNFRINVNIAIENNFLYNKTFVDYIYQSETQLNDNSLKDYVLLCNDIKGNDIYLCNDDVRYFNQNAFAQNSTYTDNTSHTWLTESMMYALSNAYFEGVEKDDAKKLESFIRQQFGVKTFTDKSFFTDVVIKNKTLIYASLVDESKMLDFLEYLKRDAERLFDGSINFNEIKDIPLLAYDGKIVKTREENILYIEYDENAKVLCEKVWCPKEYVLLSQKYTDYFSQDIRNLFKIAKFDINNITDIIASNTALRQSINSVDQNIDFWRWIKANQKQISAIDKFKNMPLLDKSNSLSSHSSLYISDTYQQEQIETLVTKYVKNALFVSSCYIEISNENEKNEWLKLFKKLGLKSDNKDILFSDILPNLSSLDTESLDSVIAMMTKHIKDLKEKWTERRGQIIQLRVRTQSGEYKTLNQTTIINMDEESVSEPFKYIILSNEVHPDIIKANKELLLLISAEYANKNLITKKQNWIEAKVKDYLTKFAADVNSVAAIHVQFVRELAKIKEEYDINVELRKQIKYRVKSNETTYMNASDLTLGSAYSPTCDFEANGVSELPYLSNEYIFEGNKDIIKTYFKAENLHQNMTREDLKYLANRSFACYFWSKCFSRRLTEYETWIKEGRFNNLVCIPTENSVQKAEQLYAPHIAGYAVRAKAPNWEDNVPCKAIVDSIESRDARELFEKLDFRNALSFEDCLYYLARVSHPREDESHFRSIVINWMLSSSYQNEEMIDNYRKAPTAEWRNGKGQKKHITELYAIHPEATQERNIFRGDEYVMQTSAFPNNTESFVKVCEILKIKCLTKDDFVATPIGKNDETAKMVAILRPRLLVLSAIENPEKFQELYEKYNGKLSQFHFVVCDKIDLGYDTIHNDVERIYNDDNHLYYVSSWKHNRTFTKFCSRLKRLIGFDVYDNVCEDVLDDSISVENCIDKYCSSLGYNEEFRAYLTSLDLSINVEIEDEAPTTLDEDYYKESSEDPEHPLAEEQETTSVEPQIESTEPVSANQQDSQVNTGADNVSQYEETNVPEVVVELTNEYHPNSQDSKSPNEETSNSISKPIPEHRSDSLDTSSCQPSTEEEKDTDKYDSYEKINEDNYTEEDSEEEVTDEVDEDYSNDQSSRSQSSNKTADYNPDGGGYMGSVYKDKDYQPVGDRPYKPRTRKHPKNFTNEEVERLRSHGTPLELESLPPTKEEIDLLAQCNIKPEQIADTNYLAQLRLYLNLTRELHEEPEESMEEFVRNADDVAIHKLKNNGYGDRYIHTCSAARGVMYASPSVWNKMVDDKWKICVYLDGQGKNFHYINNAEEFLKLVEKDDVVIKITGKEKVDVVKALYTGILEDAKGTAYTLIRVAARTNMDAVFAHYVGAMAEAEDGNDDYNNNDY